MNITILLLIFTIFCVSSISSDFCFDDCFSKPDKKQCLSCCNDKYEADMAPVINQKNELSQCWMQNNAPDILSSLEGNQNRRPHLSTNSLKSIWNDLDDKMISILSEDSQNSSKSLNVPKAKIKKNAEKKNKICKKKCEEK